MKERYYTKIKVQKTDLPNVFIMTTIDIVGTTQVRMVSTNDQGEGLWVDGLQLFGTSQFSGGKNIREAIRRHFASIKIDIV